jgi:hypothetical protein
MKDRLEILEEATAQVARNLFKLKYPDVDIQNAPALLEICISDTVFVINNFMRVSADIAMESEATDEKEPTE